VLADLLRQPEARGRMGCRGRERAEQVFGPDSMAARICEIYDGLAHWP
jgi:hypothetical protein